MYTINYRKARRIMASLGVQSKLARHFDQIDRLTARHEEDAMQEYGDHVGIYG